MSQHTPGPWQLRGKTTIFAHVAPQVLGRSEKSIIATTDNPRLPADLCEANARLIAKAPEMKDMILALVCCPAFTGQVFEHDKESHKTWTLARDLLREIEEG